MTRTALALSPHLDDAVFSCGGTLAILARRGWRVVVATLFTRSMPDSQGFALACQLDKGLDAGVDYMALRRAEDAEATRRLGLAPPVHVPLPEAPHRGYHSAPALFGSIGPDDAIAGPLTAEIRRLVADHAPDLILAPQAIGGHVDHVQVVRAIRALSPASLDTNDAQLPSSLRRGEGAWPKVAGGSRQPVDVPSILWWRDYPYVARTETPAEPFGDWMAALPVVTVPSDEEARRAKEDACVAYASQLGFQFGGVEGLREKLRQTEAAERFRGTGEAAALVA